MILQKSGKIIIAVEIALLITKITRLPKIGFISGLFFGSAVIGMESFTWISAHTSALMLIFFIPAFSLWIKEQTSFSEKILTYILLILSAAVSPGRGLLLILLFPLWDLLMNPFNRKQIIILLKKNIFFGCFVVINLFVTNFFIVGSSLEKVVNAFSNLDSFLNYFQTIGNLFIGWFVPIPEEAAILSNVFSLQNQGLSLIAITVGCMAFVVFIILIIYSLFQFSYQIRLYIFFLSWILISYLPNWIYDPQLVLGVSHRYLTISSVGFVLLMVLAISEFKQRFLIVLTGLFIVLNIFYSNKILIEQSSYRNFDVVENVWNTINQEIQSTDQPTILYIEGSGFFKQSIIDWSYSAPLGIKRAIKNEDLMPILTSDWDLVCNLLCKGNIMRPSLGKWSLQKEPVALTNLYVWKVENGKLLNTSMSTRDKLKRSLNCIDR